MIDLTPELKNIIIQFVMSIVFYFIGIKQGKKNGDNKK
jgi:hypothetical protein